MAITARQRLPLAGVAWCASLVGLYAVSAIVDEVSLPSAYVTVGAVVALLLVAWPAVVRALPLLLRVALVGGSLLVAGLGVSLANPGCRGGTGGASRLCLASPPDEILAKFDGCPSSSTPIPVGAVGQCLLAARTWSTKPLRSPAASCDP